LIQDAGIRPGAVRVADTQAEHGGGNVDQVSITPDMIAEGTCKAQAVCVVKSVQ